MTRARLARTFGLTGLWLALVLTVGAWLGLWLTLAPARAALNAADAQLLTLNTQLTEARRTLAPLDPLGRPETLEAVQALAGLARGAQASAVLGAVLPEQTLRDAVTLTGQWETALRMRPPLPALAEAQQTVQDWRGRVQFLRGRLTLTLVAFGLVFTLLGAWFAAGQWALYRLASEVGGGEEEGR